MATLPWPHRASFLAPILWLPRGEEKNQVIAGHLIATIVGEHLARHPIVAATDPDDLTLSDEQDRLVDANHPRWNELVTQELVDNRRDEVLWFELALYPPARAALHCRRRDGHVEQWTGVDDGSVSGLLASCLGQWLESRWMPQAPLAIEPFTLHDFLAVTRAVARVIEIVDTSPTDASVLVEAQSALRVPFLRVVDAATTLTLDGQILRREADNAKSRLRVWSATPGGPAAELRTIIDLAPQWGKAHLAMGGPDVPPDEALAHHAIAARLMPRSASALDAYAMSLRKAGRFEEAYRAARRATRMVPTFVHGHLHVLHALQECHRHGEAYLQSQSRARVLNDAWRASRAPMERGRRDFLLATAHMAFDVGRLDEATKIYREAVEGLGPTETVAHRNILRKWETDQTVRATAYARDAHYRNDPGGAVHGYAKAGRIDDSADAGRLVAGLVEIGREDAAAVAYAALDGARVTDTPQARLAGARALILAGELPRAYDEIARVGLRWPQYKLESEVNRLLRLAASRPIYEWDNVLRERMILASPRLSQLAARDAADFVPGIERSGVFRAIAGAPRATVVFDRAWLEPLRQALGHSVVVDIDLFFHQRSEPTLAHADKIASEWTQLVVPRRGQDPTTDAQTLYVLAHALTRYLALSTQPPTPLAGGYRQVATDALLMCARASIDWLKQSIQPFLGSLEIVAGVDPWLFDTWLLRVERLMDLDVTRDGTVRELAAGLRAVPEVLRGDERVAFELELGADLARTPDGAPQGRKLLERSVRATGSPDVAALWSRSAPANDLDAHAVAAVIGAPPWPLAAALIAANKGELAFELICRHLQTLAPKAVAAALPEVVALWPRLGLDWQPDAAQALARGEGHLRGGLAESAIRPLRWAALTSDARTQPQAWRALATAYARAGRVHDAAFAAGAQARDGKVVDAARTVGKIALENGKWDVALPAFRLAAAMTRAPEDLNSVAQAAQFAGVADDAGDPARQACQALADGDPQTARAIGASAQTWPLTRAAVTAASFRSDAEGMFPVAAAVRSQIDFLLASTNGHTDPAAVLTRVNVLRLREEGAFAVDPPPPLAPRMPRDRLI